MGTSAGIGTIQAGAKRVNDGPYLNSTVTIRLNHQNLDRWPECADERNESLTEFLRRAIESRCLDLPTEESTSAG